MYPIPGVVGVGVGARGIAWRHGVGKRWSSGDGTWGDGSSGSGRARDRAGASIEPWVCVGGRLWGVPGPRGALLPALLPAAIEQ